MKKLLWLSVVVGLLQAGAANAAPVTIDFEDVGDVGCCSSGFDIDEGFSFSGFFNVSVTPQFGGISAPDGGDGEALIMTGAASPPFVDVIQTAGLSFDLLSVDVHFDCGQPVFCLDDDWVISAFDDNNALIVENTFSPDGYVGWSTLVFDSSWTGISRLRLQGESAAEGNLAFVDNIVVDVVPIPATVWLFGSALLGLGWLRRAS